MNIEAPTAGLEGLRQVGSLGVDAIDLSAPDGPFGAYAKPVRGGLRADAGGASSTVGPSPGRGLAEEDDGATPRIVMTPTASNALSPKKLLHTKWTAVAPRDKEKHFLVTKVVEPEPPGAPVVSVEIEAVHSKRARIIAWRELTDATQWRRGWV